ncbi:MAG: PilZ domain-containing protein [Candidatus Competibacteraceae bacterium]|nr:PilZ domain-containing protein [Candidatus Competibacteraceae bacterium]
MDDQRAPKAPKQGVMSLTIRDKNTLYQAYMPFLKQGGLFIPTEKPFELGDEVFLLLTLMNEPERFPVTGRVVWITPRSAGGNRPMGIGIQFSGMESATIQQKIETYLAGTLKSDRGTHTL